MAFGIYLLVFQAMERSGDLAAAVDELGGGAGVYFHYWAGAQQAAELQLVAYLLADGGNHAHGGGLAVDHTDGGLVGDNAADHLRRGVAGNDDHIQTHGANGGHGFQLLNGQRATAGCVDHTCVLRYRDKGSGQAAYAGGGHYAAFFDSIVEYSQAG